MSRRIRWRNALLVSVMLAPAPGLVQAQQPSPAFVLLQGTGDTLAVERFTRSAERLEAEMLVRAAGARISFTAMLGAGAAVSRLEQAFRPAGADRRAPPAQSAVITFAGDSAIAEITGGGRTVTQRLGSKSGAIPFLNPSFALVEQIVLRARALDAAASTVAVPVFMVQGGMTLLIDVTRVGRDSVVVNLGGVPARLAVNERGEVQGGVVPAQGLRIVRAASLGADAMSLPTPEYGAPPGAPYRAEEVRVPAPGGVTLAGTLTIPSDARAPVPAFVTITGSGLQDRDGAIAAVRGYRIFRQIADTLARHGVAVLRLDDRGFGESGGSGTNPTSADLAADVRAALAWLRARPEIDARRVGLIGHSEGGLIAPLVAAEDSTLGGIVLMAAQAWTGRRVIEHQNRYVLEQSPQLSPAGRDSALRAAMRSVDSAAVGNAWLGYFLAHDPLAVARRVRVPALILHGATDRQVTAAQADDLAAALRAGGNARVTVRVFPETNHLFLADSSGNWAGYGQLADTAVRPAVLGALVDWVRATLR